MALSFPALPGWPDHVCVATTTRSGGVSRGPWAGFNLGDHVGDSADAVRENRRRLLAELPGADAAQWLDQEHGTRIVTASRRGTAPTADGCWTREAGLACAVLTADCLPVLLCAGDGEAVAALHAGWRGLVAGVLEAGVRSLPAPTAGLFAWLGPCIGARAFEVGPEVRNAFVAAALEAGRDGAAEAACFRPSVRHERYLADLPALAHIRLAALGVTRIRTDGRCTVADATTFFSFRRDGQTGRMASLIYLSRR